MIVRRCFQLFTTVRELLQKASFSRLVGISIIGKALGAVSKYILSIIIARGFGAGALGVFSFSFVLLQIGGIISRIGLDTSVKKFIPQYRTSGASKKVTGVVLLSIVIPLIIGFLLVALIEFTSQHISERIDAFNIVVVIILYGLPFQSAMYTAVAATQGYKYTDFAVYIRDIGQSGSAIILVGLTSTLGLTVIIAAWSYVASFVIGCLIGICFLWKLGAFSHFRSPVFEWKVLYSFSFFAFLISVSSQFVVWSDILVLSILMNSSTTGIYQGIYQTSLLLGFSLVAVNTIFPALASELFQENEMGELEDLFSTVTKWITYFTMIGGIFVVSFSDFFLGIFGDQFRGKNLVLSILVVSQITVASVGPSGALLAMTNKEQIEFWNTIIVGTLNLTLNILLINRFGMLGAGLATGISLIILNVARLVELRVYLKINVHQSRHLRLSVPLLMITVITYGVRTILGADWHWLFIAVVLSSIVGLYGVKIGADERDKLLVKSLR
jgi:O-antigen/teichoic acid export membrane protein